LVFLEASGRKLSLPDHISPVERDVSHPPVDGELSGIRPVSPSDENPPWNLVDVLAIAVFSFVTGLIILMLAMGVAHSLPRFRNVPLAQLGQNALILVPAQTVAYLIVVAFMAQLVRLKQGGNLLKAVSWNAPSAQRAVGAIAVGVGLALVSAIFTGFLSRWMPKSLPVDKLFRDASSAYLLALFGVIVAPFVEELFFRGFLYPALARRIGASASMVLTAAAFAVVHQGQLARAWVPLSWLFIVGMVLTYVRMKTKSVATCVFIHTVYNVTIFTLFFIGTQGFRHLDQSSWIM